MDAPPAFAFDFFISRRGSVAAVAREVADVLEAEGYKVLVQDYDFAAGGQFVLDIDKALKQARDLLILYSADYHASFWTRQEFANFFAAVGAGNGARRVGVLRCDAENPDGLLRGATFGDLHSVSDPAERRRIILAVARGEAPSARPTPRIFGGGMPLENRLFTGREAELAALHAALSSTGRAALTQAPGGSAEQGAALGSGQAPAGGLGQAPASSRGQAPAGSPGQAALHGLGGVGKTTLARAYVARFAGEYSGVWWITATDRSAIQTGLLDLARALDPSLPADATLEAASAQALATLAARRGAAPFLLVYDNVPSPELLDGLVPPRGAAVLVTSRASDWGGVAEEVPVDTLPEDAAAEFLQRRARRKDAAGATRLAQALGCLPLALDHAGAFVQRANITFDAYGARVAERIQAQPPRGVAYPRSVAATFGLAIEDAAREAPGAETLLGLFCWCAPEAIPLALADEAVMPEAEREAAVAALRGVSLLTPVPDGACGPAVSVHRLVQAVMRARLALGGERDAARDRAVARLAAEFPYGFRDAAVWPACRQLLPHQQAVAAHFRPGEETAPFASLLDLAASFRQGSGDAAGALPLFRRALECRERVLGPEHPDTLTSVNNLAGCMRALGDAAGALPLYRRALESSERGLGPEHPDTLTSVNNLAGCMRALGDAAGALPLFRRALQTRERVLGPEHRNTLTNVNNLPNACGRWATRRGRCRSTAARWKAVSACSARSIPTRSAASTTWPCACRRWATRRGRCRSTAANSKAASACSARSIPTRLSVSTTWPDAWRRWATRRGRCRSTAAPPTGSSGCSGRSIPPAERCAPTASSRNARPRRRNGADPADAAADGIETLHAAPRACLGSCGRLGHHRRHGSSRAAGDVCGFVFLSRSYTYPLKDRRTRLRSPCHCEKATKQFRSSGAQTSVRRATEVASSLRSSQ
ncbi:MAG TPA: tetratricopeptide repeat protein [Acetobacteraceae bacterium]|nr:tetratricopeptide repeat protein [Acetobacteraceae bacterium]